MVPFGGETRQAGIPQFARKLRGERILPVLESCGRRAKTGWIRVKTPTDKDFFIQGTNLAGLHTPMAERGFSVPADSDTLGKLLCGINERAVVAGGEQTRWPAELTGWIDVPTNSKRTTDN
jgi:hypothetical protein